MLAGLFLSAKVWKPLGEWCPVGLDIDIENPGLRSDLAALEGFADGGFIGEFDFAVIDKGEVGHGEWKSGAERSETASLAFFTKSQEAMRKAESGKQSALPTT
jgi:hypothetical protein